MLQQWAYSRELRTHLSQTRSRWAARVLCLARLSAFFRRQVGRPGVVHVIWAVTSMLQIEGAATAIKDALRAHGRA